MDIFYINLAHQTERKQFLEQNFQANTLPAWTLNRVEAVSIPDVANLPGRARDGEKACFRSHIKAIEMSRQSSGHVLIAEDDILFGSRSLQTIDDVIRRVPDDSWDIIFTDVSVPRTQPMIDLLLLRRRAPADAPVTLINLSRLPFAGSTAYIVNAGAKDKILQLLSQPVLDTPYDLFLQQAVHGNRLRGFVIFPFVTALSPHAENSQIRPHHNVQEAVMNAFRRLVWLERDMDAAVKPMDRLGADMDDAETTAFLKILAVILSPSFPA